MFGPRVDWKLGWDDGQAEIEELARLVTLDSRFAGLEHRKVGRGGFLADLAGDGVGDDCVILLAGWRRMEPELSQFRVRGFGCDHRFLRAGRIYGNVNGLSSKCGGSHERKHDSWHKFCRNYNIPTLREPEDCAGNTTVNTAPSPGWLSTARSAW